MPRVLSAPVHVFFPFWKIWGVDDEPPELDLRKFVFGQAYYLVGGDLRAQRWIEVAAAGKASYPDLAEWYGGLYRAWRIAISLQNIRSLVYVGFEGIDDSPSLDDFFFTVSAWPTLQSFESEVRDRGSELDQWLGNWIAGRRQARLKTPTVESLVKKAAEPVGNTLCWHSQPHEEILRQRRGPKNKLERRAATWGTYWISQLVGSEKLAVEYWNQMFLPSDFYWGNRYRTNLIYASKKYSDAKKRLMQDLQNQISLPSRATRDFTPHKPLDASTASAVSRFVLSYAGQTARATLGQDDLDVFDGFILLTSQKKHGWPIPQGRPGTSAPKIDLGSGRR